MLVTPANACPAMQFRAQRAFRPATSWFQRPARDRSDRAGNRVHDRSGGEFVPKEVLGLCALGRPPVPDKARDPDQLDGKDRARHPPKRCREASIRRFRHPEFRLRIGVETATGTYMPSIRHLNLNSISIESA